MRRNMDFIRDILTKIEDNPELDGSSYVVFDESDFPAHSQQEIAYHIDLLFEAGLVDGTRTLDAPSAGISRLTWQGHEFLAAISDPDVWEKVKERTKGLPAVAITVVWELAKAELKKKLGLP